MQQLHDTGAADAAGTGGRPGGLVVCQSRRSGEVPWSEVARAATYAALRPAVHAELERLGFPGVQERMLLVGELDPAGKPDPASDWMASDEGAQIRVYVQTANTGDTADAGGRAGGGAETRDVPDGWPELPADPANPRHCFYIPADAYVDGKGYVPSLVEEGVAGHTPLAGNGEHAAPWFWGMTYDAAREAARDANARLGLSEADAALIVASSMSATPPAGSHGWRHRGRR